jgi:hypothetical protein
MAVDWKTDESWRVSNSHMMNGREINRGTMNRQSWLQDVFKDLRLEKLQIQWRLYFHEPIDY